MQHDTIDKVSLREMADVKSEKQRDLKTPMYRSQCTGAEREKDPESPAEKQGFRIFLFVKGMPA